METTIENKLSEVQNKLRTFNVITQKKKNGDGKEIIINDKGVIKQIREQGNDIAYDVEFNITLTHRSAYGTPWTTDKNTFTLLHKKDSKHIVKCSSSIERLIN